MSVGVPRRRVLLGLLACGLSACSASTPSTTSESALPWPSPASSDGGLVAFLLPGLSLTDLLLAIADGEAANAARLQSRGLLIEAVEATNGTIYREEELGRALLQGWSRDATVAPCLHWSEPLQAAAGTACPGELVERWQSMVASATAAVAAGSGSVLVADDVLLTLLQSTMIADERQSGYSAAGAVASAQAVRVAVKALDAALGVLLRQLDLSAWTVALLSDSEVWPTFAGLDPAEAGIATMRLYDGGAVLETTGEVALPAGEAWAGTTVGTAPGGGSATRLLAPAGYVFATTGAAVPRATAHTGGFLLAAGAGVPEAGRLPLAGPARLAHYLAFYAGQESAPPS